jgi:hypothetical protein
MRKSALVGVGKVMLHPTRRARVDLRVPAGGDTGICPGDYFKQSCCSSVTEIFASPNGICAASDCYISALRLAGACGRLLGMVDAVRALAPTWARVGGRSAKCFLG